MNFFKMLTLTTPLLILGCQSVLEAKEAAACCTLDVAEWVRRTGQRATFFSSIPRKTGLPEEEASNLDSTPGAQCSETWCASRRFSASPYTKRIRAFRVSLQPLKTVRFANS